MKPTIPPGAEEALLESDIESQVDIGGEIEPAVDTFPLRRMSQVDAAGCRSVR